MNAILLNALFHTNRHVQAVKVFEDLVCQQKPLNSQGYQNAIKSYLALGRFGEVDALMDEMDIKGSGLNLLASNPLFTFA